MKRIYFCLIIFILNLGVFAEDYNSYELELVEMISKDNPNISLVFNFNADFPNGPTNFAFDESGNMYISDPVASRILELDFNLENLREIANIPYKALISSKPIIENGIFTEMDGSQVISIDTKSGEVVSQIFFEKSEYKDFIAQYDQNDFVFYKELVLDFLTDGRIISLQNPSVSFDANNENLLSPEETRQLIQTEYSDEIEITDSNHILINGELQTRNFKRFFSYWNDYYNGNRDEMTFTGKFYGNRSASQMRFIGKDNRNNWYWEFGGDIVVVYNSRGQVIDNFIFDSSNSRTLPAVHPSGDVYFLDYDENGIYLYKIPRNW